MKKGQSVEEAVLVACRDAGEEGLKTMQLQSKLGVETAMLAGALNNLLAQHRLDVFEHSDNPGCLVYKEKSRDETQKLKGLSTEDRLVYQEIAKSGSVGIWTRDLKGKTNLQQPQITKTLKTLEQRKLIKAVKSVANANRKVYMLYELEPARDITGGPWYTDNEFDKEFFQVMQDTTYHFVVENHEATLEDIATFIQEKGLSKTVLRNEDVQMLVDSLAYDGKIPFVSRDLAAGTSSALVVPITLEDGQEVYRRAVLEIPESSPFTSIPCGVCPVFSECKPDGVISPVTCVYYTQWLDF